MFKHRDPEAAASASVPGKMIACVTAIVLSCALAAAAQQPAPEPGAQQIAAAPAAKELTPWPMGDGGPMRYGAYTAAVDAPALALSWQYTVPPLTHASLEPIAANGLIFCAVGAKLYALRARSGEGIWVYTPPIPTGETATPDFTASPVYGNGFVYATTSDGTLHVINAQTGTSVQDIDMGETATSSPAVADGKLFLGMEKGAVLAYTLPTTGGSLKPAWTAQVAPGERFSAPVSILDGVVYAASGSGKIAAIDEKSGRVLYAEALNTPIVHAPIPTEAAVYVVSGDRLFSLIKNGLKPTWVQPFGGEITGAPAYANGDLYIVTANGIVYAFNGPAQRAVWAVTLGAGSSPHTGAIIAGSTLIVPTANGHVYAFAAGGDGAGHAKLLWRYVAEAPLSWEYTHDDTVPDITARPMVYGSDLFVLSDNGTLSCLSPTAPDDQGPTVENNYPTGGPYLGSPPPTISAEIRDPGSGLLSGSLKLSLDGADIQGFNFNPDTMTLTYTPAHALTDGSHTVEVVVSDNRHNETDAAWSFSINQVQATQAAEQQNYGGYGRGRFGRGGGRGRFGRGGGRGGFGRGGGGG